MLRLRRLSLRLVSPDALCQCSENRLWLHDVIRIERCLPIPETLKKHLTLCEEHAAGR